MVRFRRLIFWLLRVTELRLLPKSKVAVIVDNMSNHSSSNTSTSDQCCTCPKTKEQQRIEDEERQFQIEFENFLQDTLYRKGCVWLWLCLFCESCQFTTADQWRKYSAEHLCQWLMILWCPPKNHSTLLIWLKYSQLLFIWFTKCWSWSSLAKVSLGNQTGIVVVASSHSTAQ